MSASDTTIKQGVNLLAFYLLKEGIMEKFDEYNMHIGPRLKREKLVVCPIQKWRGGNR